MFYNEKKERVIYIMVHFNCVNVTLCMRAWKIHADWFESVLWAFVPVVYVYSFFFVANQNTRFLHKMQNKGVPMNKQSMGNQFGSLTPTTSRLYLFWKWNVHFFFIEQNNRSQNIFNSRMCACKQIELDEHYWYENAHISYFCSIGRSYILNKNSSVYLCHVCVCVYFCVLLCKIIKC